MNPVPEATRPRTSLSQPILFQRLRWQQLRNSVDVAMQRSGVRVFTILASSLVIWFGVFMLSLGGFLVLQRNLPLFGSIVGLLFDFLFVSLTLLLVFSSGLILYSSLFRSPEAAFLLSTPARADQVFAFKYQGALAFSSWAFVLLGSPILLAYGIIAEVPWYFYALLPLYFFGFVLLFPMLAIRGVGEGDVKMQMGFAAWVAAYFGTGATTEAVWKLTTAGEGSASAGAFA